MNYLVELIIRPKRSLYQQSDLGQTAFSFGGQDFKRIDFDKLIKNSNNEKISASLWCPLEMTTKEIGYSPCIIYCHGNVGNKIDVIDIFEFLYWEYNVCSLDFSGAGFSEGKYVTLGFKECLDIQALVNFLRKELKIQKIILWGRSMGAVSALRYAETDPNLKAIVLDSPFANFPDLIKYILNERFLIPEFLSRYLFNSARERILEKIPNFDVKDFIPENTAMNIQVPTILIHGKSDSLVPIDHSRRIYKNIPSKTYKKLLEVDGEHNSTRSNHDVIVIRDFIMQFSYDPIVLKEHKRRMLIKTAHSKYLVRNGINLQQLINKAKEAFKEKERNSVKDTSSVLDRSQISQTKSEFSRKSTNAITKDKEKVGMKKTNKQSMEINLKSDSQDFRVLNNFNIEKPTKKRNFIRKNINKQMSNMYKSESNISEIEFKDDKGGEFNILDNTLIVIDLELSRIDSDTTLDNFEDLNKSNLMTNESNVVKSHYIESKQKTTFQKEISKKKRNRSLTKINYKSFKKKDKTNTTKQANNNVNNNNENKNNFQNNILNIRNNSLKGEFFEENNLNYINSQNPNKQNSKSTEKIDLENKNYNNPLTDRECANDKQHNKLKTRKSENNIVAEKRDNNRNDDSIELDLVRRTTMDQDLLKTSHKKQNSNLSMNCGLMEEENNINSTLELDESMLSIHNNTINIGGFNYVSKGYTPNKNRLRSERNLVLDNILNCGARINSSQIKFMKIDKSSLRKNKPLNNDYIASNNEKEFSSDSIKINVKN